MKTRMLIALATVALAVAFICLAKSPFQAIAQQPPLPAPEIPPPVVQVPPPAVGPIPATPLPVQHPTPSLTQLIARLKELRKQEKDVTEQIQKVIAAQKQSLADAENELRQLGIASRNSPSDTKKEETRRTDAEKKW
jgi:hypothetical protein